MRNEARFRVIERTNPTRFKDFARQSQTAAAQRYALYRQMAGITVPHAEVPEDDSAEPAAAVADSEE
jgi:hypothetical protein